MKHLTKEYPLEANLAVLLLVSPYVFALTNLLNLTGYRL